MNSSELWGALEWLRLELTAADILDFMRTADTNKDGNIDYREFLEMVRDPDSKLEDLEQENESQGDLSGQFNAEEFAPIVPKGEEELRKLMLQQQQEEKKIAEDEINREQKREENYNKRVSEDEARYNNPRIIREGCIYFDFSTGRRPFGMTTRGNTDYKSDQFDKYYLKIFPEAMIFLPLPFTSKAVGKHINIYTVTMEIMLDALPVKNQGLFNTAVFNEELAKVYIRPDGKIGVGDKFGKDSEKCMTGQKWHVITVGVDNVSGVMNIYLDGQLNVTCESKDVLSLDGDYSVKDRVCLFGSKDKSETLGGNIRFLQFDSRLTDPSETLVFFESMQAERSWKCPTCTVINSADAVQCPVCGAMNVEVSIANAWPCPACTFLNPTGDTCGICGTPKSS